MTVRFTELGGYVPDDIQGKIHVLRPDRAFIVRHLPDLDEADIRAFLQQEFFTNGDLDRAVMLRAGDLGMKRIRVLLDEALIGRAVIDKLLRYNHVAYSIDDLVHFAEKKMISQANLELVLALRGGCRLRQTT